MELQKIREKLDKIDRSINYLIFLRTSAAVLVGETKKEQDLPIFQPKRETDNLSLFLFWRPHESVVYTTKRTQ